jgi:hypothetical protein
LIPSVGGSADLQRGIAGDCWDRLVAQYGATIWRHALELSADSREAGALTQLGWLRLEQFSRDRGLPEDPCAWVLNDISSTVAGLTDTLQSSQVYKDRELS